MSIRVLVVDDSALMRRYISQILEESLDAEIFTARDGEDALAKARELNPDVITLDVNMPVMDGLTCLSRLMTETPCPVVMVSSLTDRDALATFEALNLGAVDYVTKPGGTVSLNIRAVSRELVAKVRAASRDTKLARLRQRYRSREPAAAPPAAVAKKFAGPPRRSGPVRLVLIGVSTGGPGTLEEILPKLPADFPAPILVAQHMPATFTRVFAERLDSECVLKVEEAQKRIKLEPGHIYIAQGDSDVEVSKLGVGPVAVNMPENPDLAWHPSVDRMVRSAVAQLGAETLVGVLLTGMGDDGAAAMKELHDKGGRTIAEAEETAIIFGMPHELIERGGADVVLPCQSVASQLISWASCKD
jgi:two-component system, chemotaxis family, protein-glutamate methylesterase/glutaminase